MRVCHLYPGNLHTTYFESVGRGSAEAGVELEMVSLSIPEAPSWVMQAGGAYHCLAAPSRHLYPLAVARLARLLRQRRVDILQTHLFDAALVGLLAARFVKDLKVVVSRHHLDEPALLGARWHVILDRWMARQADSVIVPSQAVKDYMVEVESLSPHNIEAIHYGVDFTKMDATDGDRARVRSEWGVGSAPVLGMVGRLFKNKGHRYLFEAVSELVKEFPDIRIVLLGSGDEELIHSWVEHFDIRERVLLAGYRSDIMACMRAFDILVHPSLSESFGQVLVEAMAAGVAVVSSSVGGVPEIIDDGRTGILVPPREPTYIVDTVASLLRDPELRQRLAHAGCLSVREKFTVSRMVSGYLECYQNLTASKPAKPSKDDGRQQLAG